MQALTTETRIILEYLAKFFHQGQYRRGGEPYASHPIRVAESIMDEMDDEFPKYDLTVLYAAACLHDVLEDCPEWDEKDLKSHLQPVVDDVDTVIEALKILTHKKDESYADYIQRIIDSKNNYALAVKMADYLDNWVSAETELRNMQDDVVTLEHYERVKRQVQKYRSVSGTLFSAYEDAMC